MKTTISVKMDTRELLKNHGLKGETYDDIINRLVKEKSSTVRIIEEDDKFFNFMRSVSKSFEKAERMISVKPNVIMRELINAQLTNIDNLGGTKLLGVEVTTL